jgi:hypothetical protein
MNKPILFEKPSFDEALTRTPKTLGEAKEQLAIVREHLAEKKEPSSPAARAEISAGSTLPEAEPGEKIFISNGKNVVARSGRNVEVAALQETATYKRLFAAMEDAKDGRERFRAAAELGELRRTYGTGRK